MKSEDNTFEALTRKEKTQQLFDQQKRVLDCFLERGAISKGEYEKSLTGLVEKMKKE
jgi:hypothetical protein